MPVRHWGSSDQKGQCMAPPCSYLGFLHLINVKGLLQPLLPSLDFCVTGMHIFCTQMISTDLTSPLKILGVNIQSSISSPHTWNQAIAFLVYKKKQHPNTNGPQNTMDLTFVSLKLKLIESSQSSQALIGKIFSVSCQKRWQLFKLQNP